MKHLNLRGGGKMSFTFLFYKHVMLRKSCGNCHFCNTKRPSDITIADFWGWEKTAPNFNVDNKGCSLVLVNTEKGQQLFEAVKDRINTVQANLDDCLQPNMLHPTKLDSNRNAFEHDYHNRGFEFVYKKYGEDGWRSKVEKMQNKFSASLKNFIKSIIVRK